MPTKTHASPDPLLAQRGGSGPLSPRLDLIRQAIGPASFLIDVGTDHALLPLAWLGEHPSARALGIDRGEKPLAQAAQNKAASPAGARLQLRLQSGLGALCPPPAAALSISGMGGHSIRDILQNAVAVRQHHFSHIVLGPNDRFDVVRGTLAELNWRICAEDALWERGRFYPLIQASSASQAPWDKASEGTKFCATPAPDPKASAPGPGPPPSLASSLDETKPALDPLALRFGPYLLSDAHPALARWLHLQALRLDQIQARLGPKRTTPQLIANFDAIKIAWAQYFKIRYGELLTPRGLTDAPSTEHT